MQYVSPMFHFRHWDDYCSKGTRVMYHHRTKSNSNSNSNNNSTSIDNSNMSVSVPVPVSDTASDVLPECMVSDIAVYNVVI